MKGLGGNRACGWNLRPRRPVGRELGVLAGLGLGVGEGLALLAFATLGLEGGRFLGGARVGDHPRRLGRSLLAGRLGVQSLLADDVQLGGALVVATLGLCAA